MNAYNQYQENQVLSASPEQILLMLYDGAIRFTRQAITGMENNNLSQTHRGIKNSMAIITEFSNSLNHEIGGRIAEDLAALYDYMIRELLMANLKMDKTKLQGVEKLLTDLRATWGEAVETNNMEKTLAKKLPAVPKLASGAPAPNTYVHFSISG
ncbi:MAG: flagellar export chaperone FliS [Desulfocapsaceae bacterium]|nr:flagellar export chaperone FliS [Desulfocapsaceae bacterium]